MKKLFYFDDSANIRGITFKLQQDSYTHIVLSLKSVAGFKLLLA